jgi:adenosyl cobinamide kinase/adenosyl cobinamide phosphate guanylyltransferase
VITLVLGGARSGKSDFGERLVLAHDGPVLYLATGEATDTDMAERIARHRSRRDARFETIETGRDLAAALRSSADRPALVDAIGTWLAANAFATPPPTPTPTEVETGTHANADALIGPLLDALRGRRAPTVVISDEVGLGVHPETATGRRFRDDLGNVNRCIAAISTDVYLVIAGRVLTLPPAG